MIRIRILAFICGLLLAAPLALGEPAVEAVSHVAIPVTQLDRAVSFYEASASSGGRRTADGAIARMRLGREQIVLRQARGRPVPAESRSNDCGSSISRSSCPTSTGPMPSCCGPGPCRSPPGRSYCRRGTRMPAASAPCISAIRRHPLELIQYPPGKGEPRWQEQRPAVSRHRSHRDRRLRTERSLAFYRDRLGLRIAGQSENGASSRRRLSGVPGAHVRITTLRAASGPGIELLHYLAPRDGHPTPPDTSPDDLWAEEIVLRGAGLPPQSKTLRDPDGHVIRFEADEMQAAR